MTDNQYINENYAFYFIFIPLDSDFNIAQDYMRDTYNLLERHNYNYVNEKDKFKILDYDNNIILINNVTKLMYSINFNNAIYNHMSSTNTFTIRIESDIDVLKKFINKNSLKEKIEHLIHD